MSTPRIRPLPVIPPEVAAARINHLSAVVADRGLCTDFATFVADPEYRGRWEPAMPRTNSKVDRVEYLDQARRACAGCRVLVECLEMSLRHESGRGQRPYGVAGGAAPWERAALIEQRKQAAERRAAAELAGVTG